MQKHFKKKSMPTSFTKFSWALAAFCVPIFLWPVALLMSPLFLDNPALSDGEMKFMSIFFWVYPFILGILARFFYKLHQHKITLARYGLTISALLFYATVIYIFQVGLL